MATNADGSYAGDDSGHSRDGCSSSSESAQESTRTPAPQGTHYTADGKGIESDDATDRGHSGDRCEGPSATRGWNSSR